jgi:dienelactone hydrolase
MRTRAAGLAVVVILMGAACSSDKPKAVVRASTTTVVRTTATTDATTRATTTTIASIPVTTSGVKVADTAAPPDVVAPGARWVRITRADGKTQLAAVYTPASGGRHPVVVYLHGSSGLASVQVRWARQLATAGFIVVVGCYLNVMAPGSPATPSMWIECGDLHDLSTASDGDVQTAIAALIDAATTLPAASVDKIGVLGVSEGGIRELTNPDVRVKAIAADSSYARNGADPITVPVLLLGHDTDPNVPHTRVAAFEQQLRSAGKTVDSQYYAGTGHVVTLDLNDAVATNATSRVVAFFQRYLR